MATSKKQPIYNWRELVGYASSVEGAKRVLRKILTIHPSMTLEVWERPEFSVQEMGLPPGYVYSISYTYSKGN